MAVIKDDYAQVFENFGFYNNNGLSSEEVNANTKSVLFKYSWRIKCNGFLRNNIYPIEIVSPEFPNRAHSGITWYLTAKKLIQSHIIEMKLSLVSCSDHNVNANYRFRLRNWNNQNLTNWLDAPNKQFKLNDPVDTSNPIELAVNQHYLPNSNFVIIDCEITVPASQVYPAKLPNISEKQINSNFQFTENLLAMFENEEFSDVTFSVNGKELKAHTVILAAGSSVFKVMFEHDMMERKHKRVEITDIDFEVLRELIRFIYTNKVSDLEKIAKELLVASDKYDLEKLKIMCENVLCKNISTENLAEMFIFADTYHAVFLKDEAKQYIVSHSKDVSDTVGWQLMITTHPHLIAEAFIALSNKHL